MEQTILSNRITYNLFFDVFCDNIEKEIIIGGTYGYIFKKI